MKKLLVFILCAALLIMPCSAFGYSGQGVELYYNGDRVFYLKQPELMGDIWMVPMFETCKMLGIRASVYIGTDDPNGSFAIEDVYVSVKAGLKQAYHNYNGWFGLDAVPYVSGDDIMVPVTVFNVLRDKGIYTSYTLSPERIDIYRLWAQSYVVQVTNPAGNNAGFDKILYNCQQVTMPELIFSDYSYLANSFDVTTDTVYEIYNKARNNSMKTVVLETSPLYQRDWLANYFADLSAAGKIQDLAETASLLGLNAHSADFGTYVNLNTNQFYMEWENSGAENIASRAAVVSHGSKLYYYTLETASGSSKLYEFTSPEDKGLITVIPKEWLSEYEFQTEINNHLRTQHIVGASGIEPGHQRILPIVNVYAKDIPEPFNPPSNAYDNNLETRYAAIDFDAVFDLGQVCWLDHVDLSFWYYNERRTGYCLSVSEDGVNYVDIFNGMSTIGNRYEVQRVAMNARYIKVHGYGNTMNEWTSLLEIAAYGS